MTDSVRALCVTHVFPWPLDMGGAIRVDGLLRAVRDECEVTVLALARDDTKDADVAVARERLGVPVAVFPRDERGGGPLRRGARWAEAVVAGAQPEVVLERSPLIARRVRELAAGYDVVVIMDDYPGVYVGDVPSGVPVVMDKHHVLGWSATGAARSASGVRTRVSSALRAWTARRLEQACSDRCAAVVVTSEDERDRHARLYGRAPDVVRSGVDLLPAVPSLAGPLTVAWIGALDHPTNVGGLSRFVREGWAPSGLAADGGRLLTAGRAPHPAYWLLAEVTGVETRGPVADQDTFLAECNAGVVPLWHGAGVKLKTLTFLAAGLPTVTTPVGVEGLDVVDGEHCLVADTPAGLAAALRRLAGDEGLRERLGGAGRSLVAARYTWDVLGGEFARIVVKAAR